MDRFAQRMDISWDELRTDRLVAEMTAPLSVVHDEDDRKVPWTHGAAVAHAARHGALRSTTGLGHRDVLVDPSVISDAVAFVAAGRLEVQKSA